MTLKRVIGVGFLLLAAVFIIGDQKTISGSLGAGVLGAVLLLIGGQLVWG